jgi:hypothetical protein
MSMATPHLQLVAPDIWQVGDLLPLPGRVRLPVNATIIRTPDGGVLVHSPIGFDDATVTAIAELGPVRHVVAPNRLHHLFVGPALARWPDALVHLAPGLAAKRPDLARGRHVEIGAGGPLAGLLDVVVVGGAPMMGETVLFHRPSGTVLCADLVFRVTRPATLPTRLLLSLVGAGGGRLAQSRVWRFAAKDRGATRAAADEILAWPIQRVAVAHGEPYAAPDAHAALAGALVRMTGARAALPAGAAVLSSDHRESLRNLR